MEDVLLSKQMMDAFDAAKIKMAIDDMSSSRGLISYASPLNAEFIKFDRAWLSGWLSPRQRTILTWVLAQAADLGLTTVLEGVETEEHLAMARNFGFDLVVSHTDSAMFGVPRIPIRVVAHPRHSPAMAAVRFARMGRGCAPRHPRKPA